MKAHLLSCFVVVLLLLIACATPVPPRGGPKDITPPNILDEDSSPNPQVNYTDDEIRITFDEWVRLDNPATEMIISPPIDPRPIPRLNRKTLILPVDAETLADNTTYVINFGESVKDITEGNPVPDLIHVLSTGPFVDSLEFSGKIVDARTNAPLEEVKVILHSNSSDTAITRLPPSYFATSRVGGNFNLQYLRPDTFYIYALREKDRGNYRFDFGESIGFTGSPVVVGDDSVGNIDIRLFEPLVPLTIISNRSGRPHKVTLSREMIMPEILTDADISFWSNTGDTLRIWYNGIDTAEFVIAEGGTPVDTLRLVPPVEMGYRIRFERNERSFHPEDTVFAICNQVLRSFDSTAILAIGPDSVERALQVGIATDDPRKLWFIGDWSEQARYTIAMRDSALQDIYGAFSDSLKFDVLFGELIDFNRVDLTVGNLDSTESYVLRLMLNQREVRRNEIVGASDTTLTYQRLPVGEYDIELIADENGNGIWDTGDLASRRQPERIFITKMTGMRPGWDLEFSIAWPTE